MLRLLLVVILFCVSSYASAQDKPRILIAYYSQSGNTKNLAEAVKKGAEAVEGVTVTLTSIDKIQTEDLLRADAIILGSPVYNANTAPAMQEFINSWPFEGRPLKDKLGAVFVTGGGISIGEEVVMLNMMQAMLIHGMIIVGGDEVEAAFGASAITDEGPFLGQELDDIFIQKGVGLGKRVAELVLKFE